MRQDGLIEIVEERPFVPLRLHLSSGRMHVIHHPELAIVGDFVVAIGLPRDENSKIAGRITRCSLDHVIEVEPVDRPGKATGASN